MLNCVPLQQHNDVNEARPVTPNDSQGLLINLSQIAATYPIDNSFIELTVPFASWSIPTGQEGFYSNIFILYKQFL